MNLTPRRKMVLRHLLRGLGYKQIAFEAGLTHSYVRLVGREMVEESGMDSLVGFIMQILSRPATLKEIFEL